jgi:hypothetical protein
MAAFNRFIELSDAMRLELDGAKAGLTERQLARIEAQAGRNLQWHTTKFMLSVDRVMKGLSSDGRAPLNREAYTGAFDAMEIDYQALTDYAAQKPEESQQTMMFSAFQSESQSYYKNAKFLKRSLASGKTPTPRELSELFRDYNELVNWSNLLKFPDEKI